MKPDIGVLDEITDAVRGLGLLSRAECDQARSLLADEFAFAEAVDAAQSVHLHVKVDEVAALPDERIRTLGATPENATDGYVKYRFPGGVNIVFSSIPVAADDLVDGAVRTPLPFLDHAGCDIRVDDVAHRAVFDAVPRRAEGAGWRRVSQEGPVYCCHTEVAGKHWVYPPSCSTGWVRPLEVAFGPLTISGTKMGCDLRPMDPAHPLVGAITSCCAGSMPSSPADTAKPTAVPAGGMS